jgi:hypothetical protein
MLPGALGQFLMEQLRPGNELDQLGIGFGRPPWQASLLHQHPDAETRAPELGRDG